MPYPLIPIVPSRDNVLAQLLAEEEERAKDVGMKVAASQDSPLPATIINDALDLEGQQ